MEELSAKVAQTVAKTGRRLLIFSYFKDPSLECLYENFSLRQKRTGLESFIVGAILSGLNVLFVIGDEDVVELSGLVGMLLLHFFLLVLCRKGYNNNLFWGVIPHVCWHLANAQFFFFSRHSLEWVLLLNFLIYITLPLRLRYCIMFSIGTSVSYGIILYGSSGINYNTFEQYASNFLLLLTAIILGLTWYVIEDKQKRTAFLETRQSLEVKLVIEEQSAEQEQLLLSVLPEHVAVQMRQDLDRADSQFKKIYMSRHENVSILYADIVGFTAISSTYSAQELVKMLNELFARFDKLAEKYHQLRIKILGDCYYCISGAPRERPDHAVLCVHMGLSMVKAIKYVQQTANSPVDMRVGIHTGAVLAGVLGQRQWQFDVYSKDVELANKMESSGMAGRVHISATTLSFLNGEFEVEPGYGEKREEALRIAGLKTYFIGKVLKPFQPPKSDVQNGKTVIPEEDSCVISELSLEKKEDKLKINSDVETEENNINRERQNSADIKERLKKELVTRDGHRELVKSTKPTSLRFTDPHKEETYLRTVGSPPRMIYVLFFFIKLTMIISMILVLPRFVFINIIFPLENFVYLLLIVLCLGEGCRILEWCSFIFRQSIFKRKILTLYIIVLLGIFNLSDSLSCLNNEVQYPNCTYTEEIDQYCLYPSYFSYFTVLVLIGMSLPACLSYITKIIFMLVTAIAQSLINIFVLGEQLDCEFDMRDWSSPNDGKYTISSYILVVGITLSFLVKHMEQVARVLFLWRMEVEEESTCAEDMRRRNEALVYNILPPHVAAHFLGNKRRQHDELYSQSYSEVGVLFASMPNFSDFYSEETVNNQGLECLRFLNEVISDFDALLELPQFQDIIKIKTIGSTYMAASGLNPSRKVKPEDPVTVRWAHLALLVEFALELKKALQSINEQSFNHFVLKLGINHGPITAGVIGARKPHYDIWGNTVNVASRMESTGKAGCIQVTEETCDILKSFGYQFEQRGLVAVKGKGQLMTYYLLGKAGKVTPPTAPVSPIMGVGTMETLNEEDESHDTSKSDEKTVIECNGHDSGGDLESNGLSDLKDSEDAQLLQECDP
ncbi:adenylate cyclase type 3 [Coccinella septempunctata]|uniref:adenylate cyclase type 3 n=1 Tax=Coccinella septempunctata TaxID=41139 RepID=UPI001D08B161|nr:adenylate cyclase type 3 [Coccinella septempunctata]